MKKNLVFVLVATIIAGMVVIGCAAPTPAPATAPATAPAPAPAPSPTAKPAPAPTTAPAPAPATKAVTLRAISFQLPTASTTLNFQEYIKKVNDLGKGKVIIQYVGGQEIMNSADMPMAVRRGVVDMVYIPFTFYGGMVPIGHAMMLTELTGKEERAKGVWDLVREMHTKGGFYWLGRAHSSQEFTTISSTKDTIKAVADFKGMKAGAGSLLTKPFADALGMSYTQLPGPEVFSAMERGIINCYMVPFNAQINAGTQRIAKIFIDHPYFKGNISLMMDLGKFNELPKDVQTLLTSVLIDYEDEFNKFWDNTLAVDRQKMLDAGVKAVKFSPEEEKKYLDLAYGSTKEDVLKQFPDAKKLLDMMKK